MASVFGRVERLPSGRYRARYPDPTPGSKKRIAAPTTFATKGAARQWLAARQAEIAAETWIHPTEAELVAKQEALDAARKAVAFGEYAAQWVKTRTNSKGEHLRPRTRKEYERMLETGYLADWKDKPLNEIRSDDVREWRSEKLDTGKLTQTARAYDLMKSILKTAVEDGLLSDNPCRVKGGSSSSTGRKVRPPTDDELDQLIEAIEERYKALVVVAAAGGLRYGECLALTSDDVIVTRTDDGEVDSVRLIVDDQVTEGAGIERVSADVKTAAGVRAIGIYGRDAEVIAGHVKDMAPGTLLWTDSKGGYVSQSSVNNAWWKARKKVGCPDVTFHSLRHYQGTRYAQTGATLAELMARLGHASPKAAMRYQHSGGRDEELARRAAR